jgi:hypothetical protein
MMGVISVLHEDEQQARARLYEYVMNIAGHELELVEQEMVEQPDDYPEYTEARTRRALAEEDLIQKLGDPMALEPYANASNEYAAAIGVEMYLQGVHDGGRIYHAMVTRELPGNADAAELAEADEPPETEAQSRPMEPPDAEVDS